ncbi:MAG: TonB-dependent receptor [Deltaproteobacteria bacterium]|jgi:vitamin B12 transporter|nr:TonB-dependent receptor [Deltaproteobacteria bacterium]
MRAKAYTNPVPALALALVFAWPLGAPEAVAQTETGTGGRLRDVVVTATRTAEQIRDLPISPVIIDEEEIARNPNSDLGQILERAGIMVDRTTYLGGMVSIRGLQSNITGTDVQSDVLMLLNGHRIGTGNLMRFPAKNIERVEIVRGPAALQYGSASMGGVLNVITRRGAGPVTAFAEAGIGSWDQHDYAAGISGEYGGWDFSFGAAEMGRHQDYTVPDGRTYYDTETKSRSEASAQVGYTFAERHRLSAIGTFVDLEQYGSAGTIASSQNFRAGGGGKQSSTGRFLEFSYEGGDQSGNYSWEARYFTGKDEIYNSQYNNIYGGTARLSGYWPTVGLELTAGYDFTKYDYHTTSSNLGQYKYMDQGAYLVFKKYLMEGRLIVTGGLRLNDIDTDTPDNGGHDFAETKITPALGASFMATEWLKLRANYARGYRAPSANEMFGEGVTMVGRFSFGAPRPPFTTSSPNGVFLVPNPDLRPQESDSFEIGVDVDRDTFTASLTLFYSLFKAKIERQDEQYPPYVYAEALEKWPWIADYPAFQSQTLTGWRAGFPGPVMMANGFPRAFSAYASYVNYGSAKQLGVEWLVRWDVGRLLGSPVSVTPYSMGTWLPTAEYTSGPENGSKMRKVPEIFTSYGLEIESPEQGLYLDFNFQTKTKQRTSPMISNPAAQDFQPGWTVMNIRAKKTLIESPSLGTVSLIALVSNVTDVYYEVTSGYPLPGRAFYAGLRYDFR